jgi:hypothetical protein
MRTPAFALWYFQTVPPAPVITANSSQVGQVQVTSNMPKCQGGSTACGLSDCQCWVQLWRARCSSSTSCPAPSTSSFTELQNVTAVSWGSDAGDGTTGVILQDADPALAAGTTWAYFETTNYAKDPNYTSSPPSNSTGPVQIAASTATTLFSVYLDFDNAKCTNKTNVVCSSGTKPFSSCTCSMTAYRAQCGTSCPTYPAAGFTKLPGAGSSTVSSTNTHFRYTDDGSISGNLAYGVTYSYAVTNTYTADSTATAGGPTQLTVKTPLHMAVVNFSNPGCNTTTQACVLQVYRAQCASSTSCPAYPAGTWAKLSTATVATTVGAQGTTWRYSDTDPALKGATTYSWVGVNTWPAGAESPASAAYIATTKP